jgi:hypothetical protein
MSDLTQATDTDAFTKLHANVDDIGGRVLWLERKLAELLDGVCAVMGLAAGWVVADVLVGGVSGIIPGIIWLVCLLGTYAVVTLVLKRVVFKGAHTTSATPYDRRPIRSSPAWRRRSADCRSGVGLACSDLCSLSQWSGPDPVVARGSDGVFV